MSAVVGFACSRSDTNTRPHEVMMPKLQPSGRTDTEYTRTNVAHTPDHNSRGVDWMESRILLKKEPTKLHGTWVG